MADEIGKVNQSLPHSPRIEHDPKALRFFTTLEGAHAYLEYQPRQGAIAITHTIVPPAIGGRGIAGALVRAAVDYARSERLKVIPACSYAEAWMRRHPEYDELRGT